MKIKKGDTVKILSGKDKNKTGKVVKVDPTRRRVIVEGIHLFKKHVKPKKQGEKGEIVEVARPMHVSNAALVCSSCSSHVRPAYRVSKDKKVRYCRKCNSSI